MISKFNDNNDNDNDWLGVVVVVAGGFGDVDSNGMDTMISATETANHIIIFQFWLLLVLLLYNFLLLFLCVKT